MVSNWRNLSLGCNCLGYDVFPFTNKKAQYSVDSLNTTEKILHFIESTWSLGPTHMGRGACLGPRLEKPNLGNNCARHLVLHSPAHWSTIAWRSLPYPNPNNLTSANIGSIDSSHQEMWVPVCLDGEHYPLDPNHSKHFVLLIPILQSLRKLGAVSPHHKHSCTTSQTTGPWPFFYQESKCSLCSIARDPTWRGECLNTHLEELIT